MRTIESVDMTGTRTIQFFSTPEGGVRLEFSDYPHHNPIVVSEKVASALARPLGILIHEKPETVRALVHVMEQDAAHLAVVLDALTRAFMALRPTQKEAWGTLEQEEEEHT